jgi:hypothetical protein
LGRLARTSEWTEGYASTAKKRQLCLFRQGQYRLRAIWNRPLEDEERMLSEFGRLVHDNTFFRQVFEVIN